MKKEEFVLLVTAVAAILTLFWRLNARNRKLANRARRLRTRDERVNGRIRSTGEHVDIEEI